MIVKKYWYIVDKTITLVYYIVTENYMRAISKIEKELKHILNGYEKDSYIDLDLPGIVIEISANADKIINNLDFIDKKIKKIASKIEKYPERYINVLNKWRFNMGGVANAK